MLESGPTSDHIRQLQDAYVQVTGGALEKIGDEYQLIFGQGYPGRHRPSFNGVQTRQVQRFQTAFEAGVSAAAFPTPRRRLETGKEKRASDIPPEFSTRAFFQAALLWPCSLDFPPEIVSKHAGQAWLRLAFRSAVALAERPKND